MTITSFYDKQHPDVNIGDAIPQELSISFDACTCT